MGAEFARKATRFEDGKCSLLIEHGGDMMQMRATPALEALGIQSDPIPPQATAIARISAPALFGAGLVEAVPDEEILEQQDPEDRNRDGISGRAATALGGGVGRFGRKGTFATIRSFVVGALAGEMGITSAQNLAEEKPGGNPLPAAADPAPEPEIDSAGVNALTRFVQLLAAPAPEVPASNAVRDTIERGRRLFDELGCTACHTPSMRTGRDGPPALRRKTVQLYSDLLLHDMGKEAASICAPGVFPSEWMTPSLMGLRFRQQFLRDGRAQRLEAAIAAHDGEAAASRDRFDRLPPVLQAQLVRFLRSL